MSQSSSIMDKLAWRAKWRKRWQKWKTMVVVIVLLAVLIPAFLAFTPWAPQMVYDWIDKHKTDPISNKIDPEFANHMYTLGMFYSITLRDQQAMHCWRTVSKWYYGYDIKLWAAESHAKEFRHEYAKRKRNRLPFNDEAKPYVGYSLFRMGEYLDRKKHKGQAKKIYEKYLDDWKNQPREDGKFTQLAETFLLHYGAGG